MAEQNVPGNTPVAENPVVNAKAANGPLPVKPGQVVEGPLTKNNAAAANKTGRDITDYFKMAGVILVESAAGFGTGFTLAKNNVAGVTLTLIVMSVVYGLEFWTRYSGPSGSTPLLIGGLVALVAAGLVPYLSMTQQIGPVKNKAKKTASVYLPTIAASWSAVALIFGLTCAGMSGGKVLKSDAIQGVILSLLYAGVTTALGYNVGTPGAAKSGNTTMSLMAWGALVLFDLAGLARGPSA
jgi:hypothetical protein